MASARKQCDPETLTVEAGLLLDVYGALLTRRQRQFMLMHFEQDLSFSEIGREFGISRQAVHDSVRHALASLAGFEKALGLIAQSCHGAPEVEGRIGGRQLVERLRRLRGRIAAGHAKSDPDGLLAEVDALIRLLEGGEEAGEPE